MESLGNVLRAPRATVGKGRGSDVGAGSGSGWSVGGGRLTLVDGSTYDGGRAEPPAGQPGRSGDARDRAGRRPEGETVKGGEQRS